MSELKIDRQSAEELCEQRGLFYRHLFPHHPWRLRQEEDLLNAQFARPYEEDFDTIAMHIAGLDEDERHYKKIQSFLQRGKIGRVKSTSISNRFVPFYTAESAIQYPNDLVVVMALRIGDVVWSIQDNEGHKGGYPAVPYTGELEGVPVGTDFRNPTFIPPDRIIGFYRFR